MARTKRTEEEDQELNLAPIMNMVVILIPLLLLSVVFLEVTVINITAPKLSIGKSTETPPEEKEKPLNMTVTLAVSGIRIAAEGGIREAIAGCPADGSTICLKDQSVNNADLFQQARQSIGSGKVQEGEALIEKALNNYRWRELYNELAKIKKQYPEETVVNISADPTVPFSAIVRLMDVMRYQLEKDNFDQDKMFWDAKFKKAKTKDGKDTYASLFSDPVLSVVQ